jgi:hypothetical protein
MDSVANIIREIDNAIITNWNVGNIIEDIDRVNIEAEVATGISLEQLLFDYGYTNYITDFEFRNTDLFNDILNRIHLWSEPELLYFIGYIMMKWNERYYDVNNIGYATNRVEWLREYIRMLSYNSPERLFNEACRIVDNVFFQG